MNPIAVERSRAHEVLRPEAINLARAQQMLQTGEQIKRVSMERVDRRVGLRLFGHWFGYESSNTQRRVETVQLSKAEASITDTRDVRQAPFVLAGGGVAAIASLGLILGMSFFRPAPPVVKSDFLLATLPASRPMAPPVGRMSLHQTVAPHRDAKAHLVAPQPKSSIAEQPDGPAGGFAVDGSLTLGEARAAALASGEPSYWTEGSRSGVVVAGPEHSTGLQNCRLVAVFTRVNGDRGSTQSTTQCRPASAVPKD